MEITYSTALSAADISAVFNLAFSDYLIPMVIPEKVMELKLTRDGTNLAVSPVAREERIPVGFVLNALGEWQGKKTAYNGGTGVVPAARGQGLTEQMYQNVILKLQEQGVEQCLLEVIQENMRAFKVYQRLGFEVVRSFKCYKQTKEDLQWHPHAAPTEVTFETTSSPNWSVYQTFWDVEPSWQHHTAALDRSWSYVRLVEARVQNQCVGYGVLYEMTGSLAHLAVAPTWRGKGIGQALLQQLLPATNAPAISVINVDAAGKSMQDYLTGRNVTEIQGQYEMVLPLVKGV